MKTDRMEIRIGDELKTKYTDHAAARGMALGSWVLNACAEQYDREQTTGKIKLRKSRLEIVGDGWMGNESDYATRDVSEFVGQEFYLVQTDCGNGYAEYDLRQTPAVTNISHEPKVRGWCGSTNNVSISAEGRVVVIGQSRTHVHLGTLPDTEED